MHGRKSIKLNFMFPVDYLHHQIKLQYKKRLLKNNIWSIALHGAGTWRVQKVDLIYLETFEMWNWRRMEKTILLIM